MARTCPTFDQCWEHLVRVPSHLPHIHVAMAQQKDVVTCPQIQINSTSFCIRLLLHKHPPKSWEPKWTKGCQVGLSRSDSFRSSKIQISAVLFRISDFSFVLFGGYDDNVRRWSVVGGWSQKSVKFPLCGAYPVMAENVRKHGWKHKFQ